MRHILYVVVLQALTACTAGTGGVRDPGSPTPAAAPTGGPDARPAAASPRSSPDRDRDGIPVRPEEAPVVTVREILQEDSLVGRRVRVAGECLRAGAGRSKGSWILEAENATIEVRGLVPPSCSTSEQGKETLTIFAQIEPKEPDSPERLLLRLPD
jgi:hypothetical protein